MANICPATKYTMAETQLQEQLQYSFLEERTFSQFSNTVEFADLLRCEAKWRPNQQVSS